MPRSTTDTPSDVAGRLDRLAEELHAAGVLSGPWRDALRAVPRHLFIPDRAWIYRDGEIVELDRGRDPGPWWDAVYSPTTPIVTQFDDRAGPPGGGRAEPSSSCPAPKTQFELLDALDLRDGMNVLEKRFGLTVTPDAHLLWLDEPTQPVVRIPASAASGSSGAEAPGRLPGTPGVPGVRPPCG